MTVRFFAMLLSLSGFLLAENQPTLVLEFDDGFAGTGAGGKPVEPRLAGKPELAEGKFGKAFKSGPATGYLHFPTASILNPQAGTVEMWVCPVDWTPDDDKFHVFLDAHGKGVLYFYKYFRGKVNSQNVMLLTGDRNEPPFSSAKANIGNWKRGEWHHLAASWSPTQLRFYVDGVLVQKVGGRPQLPLEFGSEFLIGDHPWHIERTSSSLIDRVRIYDRALADEHIAAHFTGDYNRQVTVSDRTVELQYRVDLDGEKLVACARLLGVDENGSLQARFTLARKGKSEETVKDAAFANHEAQAEFPTKGLAPGDFELSAKVSEGGKVRANVTKAFVIPATPWLGNRLGLEEKVLPPWTPLVQESKAPVKIGCWGRTYQFNASPFPSQITSQGQALLARPISLTLRVAGARQEWQEQKVALKTCSPTFAEVEGSAATGTGVRVSTRTRLEYDGLMVVNFRLEVPAGMTVDGAALDICLPSAVAQYRHGAVTGYSHSKTGAISADADGVVECSSYRPFTWVGDNDRGLFWFCESARHWPNWWSDHAFEMLRQKDEVILRFNLVSTARPVTGTWEFQFGLQATPVKPLPPSWRKLRWDSQNARIPGAALHFIWTYAKRQDCMPYFGYPGAASPPVFAERVQKLTDLSLTAIPYTSLSYQSRYIPAFAWFSSSWAGGVLPDEEAENTADSAPNFYGFQQVCPQSRSYADFIVWQCKEFMEEFKLGGYYHDNASLYACLAADHPACNWRDETGGRQPVYPMLAWRQLYRRLYATVKSVNPNAFLIAHNSGQVAIPVLAYEDAYLEGEQFRNDVKDCYLDVVQLDKFRAEFMGRQWGLVPFFIPELINEYAQKPEPTRGLAGLLLAHDVLPMHVWCNIEEFQKLYKALDQFGYVDAQFLPYFAARPAARTAAKNVIASVYKRSDGRALAVVANPSREPWKGPVIFNPEALGMSIKRVSLFPDGALLESGKSTVPVEVPALDYRLLLIE